ncbi:hypothetical protein [Staphylococcus cohnii]|uniref:hypothetical protein n=1 Tax=Staphylococcus cohnii TaxID=29382 RepID=UPI003CF4B7C4
MANPFWWLYKDLDNDEDKINMIKKEIVRIGSLVHRNPDWAVEFVDFNNELKAELNKLIAKETEPKFIQHNDDDERTTRFQCPKCHSYNVEREKAYGDNTPVSIVRSCEDCGYRYTTKLYKEDK